MFRKPVLVPLLLLRRGICHPRVVSIRILYHIITTSRRTVMRILRVLDIRIRVDKGRRGIVTHIHIQCKSTIIRIRTRMDPLHLGEHPRPVRVTRM